MYINDGQQAQDAQTDEPIIKIQNGGIANSDIRQIKLNYIQLNKRATTANYQGGNGRKIPLKQNNPTGPAEYQNIQNAKSLGNFHTA